jgi:L-alanine-DL-glutamate epimerase-like enolase superfamily enzyme
MNDRPAVFVRLTDSDGATGLGEIFANWPAAGAEHRVRLLMMDIADLVLGRSFDKPGDLLPFLEENTKIRALQCGEWGPFRQVNAGLDTALHDLAARKAGVSLARYLSPGAADSVPAYASGIPAPLASEMLHAAREDGFRAFKLKIGFDQVKDRELVRNATAMLAPGERLFTDANQAWDAVEAQSYIDDMRECGVGWLEEPIIADAPAADWLSLKDRGVAIAGGENMAGYVEFEAAIASGVFGYLQPDVAKWGGVSGCFAVAREIIDAGITYCPHFLGGGIGLVASAHLLAAAGGPGLLEIDVNPNPLRAAFPAASAELSDGRFRLPDGPGIGIDSIPEELERYRSLSMERRSD